MLYHYINNDFRTHNRLLSDDINDHSSVTHLEMRCFDRDQTENWLLVSVCENATSAETKVADLEAKIRENIRIWFEQIKGYKIDSIERTKSGWKIVCHGSLTITGATREDVQNALEMWKQSKEDMTPRENNLPTLLLPDTSNTIDTTTSSTDEPSLQKATSTFQGTSGQIFMYDSIIHGPVQVEFIKINDVENWPIQTAQVLLNHQEISVRTKSLTPIEPQATPASNVRPLRGVTVYDKRSTG